MKALRKKTKIILLTLVSVFLLSSLSILIFNCVRLGKQKHNEPKIDAAYTFNDVNGRFESEDDSNYLNNTDFYITTPKGLHEFSVSVAYDCTFYGKNVYLSNDIDMSGWNWQPIGTSMNGGTYHTNGRAFNCDIFQGTFDGDGHTISNLTTTITDSPWGSNFVAGFIGWTQNMTVIKNLKIKDFTVKLEENNGYAHVGGFVGFSNGGVTIENCILDGFKIETKVTKSYYAGMVGMATTMLSTEPTYSFKDIILKNFSISGDGVDSSTVNSIGNAKRIENVGVALNYSIANYVMKDCAGTTSDDATHTNEWNSTTKKFTNDNSIQSSVGGADESVEWYYGGSSYNDGYPYLRKFIHTWQSIQFACGSSVSLSQTSITIPTKNTDGVAINANSWHGTTVNPLNIYNQEVKATVGGCFNFSCCY